MRADFIPRKDMEKIISCMHSSNALAMRVCLATGIRISDCLNMTRDQVTNGRPTIRETKTGKSRRIYIQPKLREEILAMNADSKYAFPSRLDKGRPRTRQAVYKDLKNQTNKFSLKENVSVHSTRKIFAVEKLKRTGSLDATQKILNHKYQSTTIMYALSDVLGKPNKTKKQQGRY